jgi:hypothetical protein
MGAGDRIEHVARCGVLEEGAAGTGTPDVLDVLVHLERGELDGLVAGGSLSDLLAWIARIGTATVVAFHGRGA